MNDWAAACYAFSVAFAIIGFGGAVYGTYATLARVAFFVCFIALIMNVVFGLCSRKSRRP